MTQEQIKDYKFRRAIFILLGLALIIMMVYGCVEGNATQIQTAESTTRYVDEITIDGYRSPIIKKKIKGHDVYFAGGGGSSLDMEHWPELCETCKRESEL